MSGEDAHVHAPKTKDEGFGLARFDGTSDRKMRQKTPEGMARRSDLALRTVASAMTRSGMERIRIPETRAGKEGRNAWPENEKGPAHGGAFGAPGRMRGRAGRARRPCLPRAFPAVRRAM
ncbi:hypothetical protein HMPREF0762_00001, partial [Slackia exigua ATCC 700122]